MFKFENLHRNHKLAYLDGLLSGLVVAYLASACWKDYQESKAMLKLAAETDNNN